jgi:hypothetical protein
MGVTLDSQTERYLQTFKTLTKEEQRLVTQLIERIVQFKEQPASEADCLAAAIAGRHFSEKERVELEMETLGRHFLHRRQLLQGAFTASQVAEMLSTSRQTPHDRVRSQTLLAIKDNGMLRFPFWQFDLTGPNGVIEGLPQVLKALQMSDYAKLNWLTRPNPYLDNLTPIEALKRGEKERVLREAVAAGADQWS